MESGATCNVLEVTVTNLGMLLNMGGAMGDRIIKGIALRRAKSKAFLALKGRGFTLTDVADSLGYSVSYIHHIVAGRMRNPVIEHAIAKATGKKRAELFKAER